MAADPDRHGPPARAAFARFVPIATRWSDNDTYGHLNNVVYYSLFDSAVNAILVEAGLLDPATSPIVGLVVESKAVRRLAGGGARQLGVGDAAPRHHPVDGARQRAPASGTSRTSISSAILSH